MKSLMDFLDPKKKRAHLRRLYLGYALMAVVIFVGTIILVFTSYGYDIDRHTGSIIQNGLAVVDTHPTSATILVNGIDKGSTDKSLVLPAGKYNIELHADGYRNWKHDINLEGSSIEQLVYPFLFPEKLITKPISNLDSAPSMSSASPDRHWLVFNTASNPLAFSVVDLNNAKNPITPITLSGEVVTLNPDGNSFEAVEWSSDNVHLLLKHTFGTSTEFILIDRENPAASLNLNKVFAGHDFSQVNLRDKKPDQFYMFNAADATLSEAETKTNTFTPTLAKVLSYKSYQQNILLYVTDPAATSLSAEVHVRQGDQDHVLRTLPAAAHYLLDMAEFDGHFYLASGSPIDGKTYLYKDPFSDFSRHPAHTPQPSRVLIVPNAEYISFSTIDRFVVVQGGSMFAVYDAETGRQFRYDTKLDLSTHQKAAWMDGHRLSLISGGVIDIFDFDGSNIQALVPAIVGYTPIFDRDYTALFTFAHKTEAPEKTTLTRTELKAQPPSQKN